MSFFAINSIPKMNELQPSSH